MEARTRFAVLVGAAVLLVGAVLVLREPGADSRQPPPPPHRTLTEFRGAGVLLPAPDTRPATPLGLTVEPGSRRLVLRWQGDAPGYEVTWDQRTRLVAGHAVQLTGLADGEAVPVEVRAVDAFGRRSEPARGGGTPSTPQEAWSYADRFTGTEDEVGARWQLVRKPGCAWAGPEAGRLVLEAGCGEPPTGLRARTPLRLREDGGRVVLETGADRFTVDLVPGPADQVDENPPPGALRVEVTGSGVRVRHPGGEARLPPVAPPPPGLSQRWELALSPTALRVLADGREVGATPVRRDWREATVLLGFPGRGSGITRTELDLVAYDAEPVPAPPTGTARLDRRLSRPGPPLADPSAELHDAAGRPVPAGEPMPRGRAVLEIRLTATTPEVAGLAGLEVRLDGERLAVLPTAADGPAVAGTWRIALNLADTTAGPHNIEVRAVGTSWDTAAAPVFVPIMVAQ